MKTIVPGKVITSLDQLWQCEFVLVHDKPIHKGWFSSWQMRLAALYVNSGRVYEGIRITKEDA